MKNIIYPLIGTAAQHGIHLALIRQMNLRDAVKEAQMLFRCSTRKMRIENTNNWLEQIESIVKRGFFELSKLGQLKTYQKTKKINDIKLRIINGNKWLILKNSKKKRDIRFDFEFVPLKNQSRNILVELKVTWTTPKKISNRIKKQLITYSKNSSKRCIVCFLVVKQKGRKNDYINTFPYWYEINVKNSIQKTL